MSCWKANRIIHWTDPTVQSVAWKVFSESDGESEFWFSQPRLTCWSTAVFEMNYSFYFINVCPCELFEGNQDNALNCNENVEARMKRTNIIMWCK